MGMRDPGRSRFTERIPFVEGLRGLAALYVVLGHLCSMSDPSNLAGKASTAPIWFQRLTAPFAFGHLAVAAFIVISGFCLQLSLFGGGDGRIRSAKHFFSRRARRILPAYYGCLALSLAVAVYVTPKLHGMPFEMYGPVTRENVLAHLLLIHNFSPAWMYKLNGVLWSISIEAQLYILFPLIVAGFFRIGRWWTLALASIAAIVVLFTVPDALKLYSWFLPLFALGMASAHLIYRPHPRIGLRAGVAKLIAGVSTIFCLYGLVRGWLLPVTDALAGLAVASLCYYGTVDRPTIAVRLLSARPLVALGAFSYSLYLMHHPIQQVVYWLRPGSVVGEAAVFGYLMATLPIILFGAWLFSLVFERPFIGKKIRSDRRTEFVPVSLPLCVAGTSDTKPVARTVERRSPGALVQAT
jgi:peptidoglycan/LPS O-acetylase OafA/YrhL